MTHPDPYELGLNSPRGGFSKDKEAHNKRLVHHVPMGAELWGEIRICREIWNAGDLSFENGFISH